MQITTKIDGRITIKMHKRERDIIRQAQVIAGQLGQFAHPSQHEAVELEKAAGNLLLSMEIDKQIEAKADVPFDA